MIWHHDERIYTNKDTRSHNNQLVNITPINHCHQALPKRCMPIQ